MVPEAGSLRQDRYSIRTASQWLGPVLEDLLLAHKQVTIECNSVTDNPLVDTEALERSTGATSRRERSLRQWKRRVWRYRPLAECYLRNVRS
jgi:histidine ammonia-lyase